jgi:Immunoglobulin I-set domain
VAVGESATFNVTASGTTPFSYQWSFDTTNLVGATNATLMLDNVQFAQAGNYAVQVSNVGGATLSSNAVLTVVDKLDHFSWNPILSPRFVNVPITVIVQAQDATNGIFTNFSGTVILSSTNGIPINPAISTAFVQGTWTGSITISQPATNLVLQASDSNGALGVANVIDVDNLPILGLTLSGSSMLIYWPVASTDFVLETSASLSPAQWVQVAIPPFQIGSVYLESVPINNTNQFYRLQYTHP